MKKLLGGTVVALIAIAGCGGGDDESGKQYEAKDSCHEWVKERLKSPSTASFSGDTVSGSNGDYTIAGAVDSQNSFGATVRSTWTCTIRLDGNTWRGSVDVQQS